MATVEPTENPPTDEPTLDGVLGQPDASTRLVSAAERPRVSLPRHRITVRRLMVAVTIVAVLLGVYVWVDTMVRRSAEYEKVAIRYQKAQKDCEQGVVMVEKIEKTLHISLDAYLAVNSSSSDPEIEKLRKGLEHMKDLGESYRRKVEYMASQREKYRRASRHPWLQVTADLPMPK